MEWKDSSVPGRVANNIADDEVVLGNVQDDGEADFKGATLMLESDSIASSAKSETCSSLEHPSYMKAAEQEFFALRHGSLTIETAARKCKSLLGIDSELISLWLLTEIDHWDIEKERLVLLTGDDNLFVVKYDFIAEKLINYKTFELKKFDNIVVGELKYPNGSLIPSRNRLGIRMMWNHGNEIPFATKWNPFSNDVPWLTFMSHPFVIDNPLSVSENSYEVDDFSKHIIDAMKKLDENQNCQMQFRPIIIENYAGVMSAFHNISNLGFFKVRGKFSF